MARIRTIKPEFPQSESLGRVSRDARLLFAMLWTICDDEGRARANSRMLASLLFPYDDDAPQHLPEWLMELERENCIKVYAIDGNAYLHVINWSLHQKIDKPTKSRLPSPPQIAKPRESSRRIRESSRRIREASSEDLVPSTKDLGRDQVEVSSAPQASPTSPIPESVPKPKVTKPDKGRRWGAEEQIPPNWLLEAEKARDEHELPRIDLVLEARKFANHWASKAGKNATHTDWKLTWINWALNGYGAKNVNGRAKKPTATDSHLAGIAMLADELESKRQPGGSESG